MNKRLLTLPIASFFLITFLIATSCSDDNECNALETSVIPLKDGCGGLSFAENSKKENKFEYTSLMSWADLNQFLNEHQGSQFFDELTMDATKNPMFKINSFEIKTYDVSEDYYNYCISVKANQSEIGFTKNDAGETVWDGDTKENPYISYLYQENTKDLKPNINLGPTKTLNEISGVFDLDKIFDDRLKNTPENVALRTKLIGTVSELPKMVRVDICVGEVERKINDSELRDKFAWQSIIGGAQTNKCISESFNNVLDSKKLKDKIRGKVLYSYYLADNAEYFNMEE